MFYLFLLLGFVCGGINVVSKTINYQATNHLGTACGTLINYLVASLLSALVLLFTGPQQLAPARFASAPWWLYLGGVCGLLAMLINVTSLHKISLFQSTTMLLVGQLVGAVILDALVFRSMSLLKAAGVAVLAAGVVWDKRLCTSPAGAAGEGGGA